MKNRAEISFCVLSDFDNVSHFLQEALGLTRSKIKKFNLTKKFLNKRLRRKDPVRLPLDLLNNGMINPVHQGPEIEILHEDENVIVMDKPFNHYCHPLSYSEQDNCLSFLRSNNYPRDILDVNYPSYDRGLLYRLDYGTSGVLFYIKKQKIYTMLRDNFSGIAKAKIYLAIVEGELLEDKEGTHTHLFRPKGERGNKMVVSDGGGQRGELIVSKLQFNQEQNVSLVKVALNTGIRHQIRSQLSHLGHPILGDELYGGRKERRIYLHAYNYLISFAGKIYDQKSTGPLLFDHFFGLNGRL